MMKIRLAASVLLLLAVGIVLPVPAAHAGPVAPALSVVVSPTELVPAQAGFVYVGGGYPLSVSVTLDDAPLDVFWSGEGYIALFAFDFDEPPGEHLLTIEAYNPLTGESLSTTETLTVLDFAYPQEQLALPYRLVPLLEPELNQNELDRLDAIYATRTYPDHWDWPYALPVPGGVVTSRFGNSRTYNGGMWAAHHTGTDFRRAIGEPVQATAGGRVAVADSFDIRGNVVIIDHGYGVFSQYAHLSEILVEPGQIVRRGDVIGLAGNTGRINGPHLHFEIIVNGITVDPIRWLALKPGFVPPREVIPHQETPEEISAGS